MTEALIALLGAAAGFAVAWFIQKSRLVAVRVRLETQLEQAQKDAAGLENAFKAAAGDALRSNNEAFLSLAQQALEKHLAQATGDIELRKKAVEDLVKPIQDGLKLYHEKADTLERERQKAYGELSQQLVSVAQTQEKLKLETGNLVSALRQPNVRGRWGELTLRRVVELAGLSEHCDFTEQQTVEGEDGALRPDLLVHLPNKRDIVIDSKAVLIAYLEAQEAQTDDARAAALQRHAVHLRERSKLLSGKRYWDKFGQSADFVVLFIPGEPFLAAAVQIDPGMIEESLANRVVIATPTTLVALLKAVAYGWRQEQMAEGAREVADLGKKLLDAVAVWATHLKRLRGAIFDMVQTFNNAQGSLEQNVLPKARRMKELGVQGEKEVPLIEPVNEVPRAVEFPEGK
ncbi:MAG TPA: DNA recombination protein RmuC [Planctomycetota bacterium]|nr:DNA recombination protein RmuC [Planctomycetota bacterium]